MVPRLLTPWQDTISDERIGWRQRAANLNGEFAFAVDYEVCRRCRADYAMMDGYVPDTGTVDCDIVSYYGTTDDTVPAG